jgi:hypothetical protein
MTQIWNHFRGRTECNHSRDCASKPSKKKNLSRNLPSPPIARRFLCLQFPESVQGTRSVSTKSTLSRQECREDDERTNSLVNCRRLATASDAS